MKSPGRMKARGVRYTTWPVAAVLVASVASAQAPDEFPDSDPPPTAAAPTPQRRATQPPAARPAPPGLQVGQVLEEFRIVSLEGPPRLADGRPARGVCGYSQDVVVTKIQSGPAATTRTTIHVPCTRRGGTLVAAPPLLAQDLMFTPVRASALTQVATLKSMPAFTFPEEVRGASLVYLVKVSHLGEVFDVHLVQGISPDVDAAAQQALIRAKFNPAESCGVNVDSVVRHVVRLGAPAVDPRVAQADSANGPQATDAPHPATNPAGTKAAGEKDVVTKVWPVPEKPFQKGELSNFGTVAIENPKNSLGIGVGATFIDDVCYLVLRPNLDLHWNNFHLGVGAPVRFEVLSTQNLNIIDPNTYGSVTANTGRFRSEDWDQTKVFPYTDLLRPLRYLRYGKKEDHLYVDVTRTHAQTIGHWQLMRRYTPNLDVDQDLLMAEVDGYLDFGGVELVAGPLPIPRLVGGLIFIKPLGLFLDDTFSKSLSIGVSYVSDLNAPTSLATGQSVADGRTQFAVHDNPGQERAFEVEGRGQILGPRVQGAGIDAEIKVFRNDFLDVKVYADYSHLFFPGSAALQTEAFDAGGATLGGLFRLSFGAQPAQKDEDLPPEVLLGEAPRELLAEHAFRLRVEARGFEAQYLPSYFNTLYEADKYQFGMSDRSGHARAGLPTKIAALAAQAGEPIRGGIYLEGSYQWVPYIAVTAVYEDAWAISNAGIEGVGLGRNLAVHAETLGLGWFQLFATYHFRNFANITHAFQFSSENEVFFSGLRWRILPFLFVNAAVQRTFGIGYSKDDSQSLRNLSDTDPRLVRFSSVGLKSAWSGVFDIELGWQF